MPWPPAMITTGSSLRRSRTSSLITARSATRPAQMSGIWRMLCSAMSSSSSSGPVPSGAVVGVRWTIESTGSSRLTPRSSARRTSPSVTVPTRRRSSSTTSAISTAPASIASMERRSVAPGGMQTRARRDECTSAALPLQDAGGDADHGLARVDVAQDDRAGADDGARADPHALQDARAQADVGALADDDGAGQRRGGGDVRVVADDAVVVDDGGGVDDDPRADARARADDRAGEDGGAVSERRGRGDGRAR